MFVSENQAKPLALHLPGVFCWSKMGAESGQELARILLRKELERKLGAGVFGWGIGNSLRAEFDARTAKDRIMPVVFSTMISRAKMIDREPAAVWLWQSYKDSSGRTIPLPRNMLVTSRAKRYNRGNHRPHYALFCHSDVCLSSSGGNAVLDAATLRNAATGRPLGHSQVSALVRIADVPNHGQHKFYPITVLAQLVPPYCASLSEPIALPQRFRRLLDVTEETSLTAWANTVETIRAWARVSSKSQQQLQF
jgi:hypothetical protein